MSKVLILFTSLFFASDLQTLSREYQAHKTEVLRKRGNERKQAIEKLIKPVLEKAAGLKTDQSVSFLSGIVLNDIPDFSGAACRPLASTGKPAAVQTLLQAVRKRPGKVAEAALSALYKEKTKLTENQVAVVKEKLLRASREDIQEGAVRLLGIQNTVPAAKALLQALAYERIETGLISLIEECLSNFQSKQVEEFLFGKALAGGYSHPRQLVALLHLAGELKYKEAAPVVRKYVRHSSPKVAGAAIQALFALGRGSEKNRVLSLLRKWRNRPEPAIQLLSALSESKSPEAGLILAEVSRKLSGPLKIAATRLLGRVKTEESLSRILEALNHRNRAMRTAALKAVQQFRNKRIVGPLIEFMGRERGRLQGEAYKFLVRITNRNMGLSVEDWKKWWSYAQKEFSFKPEKEEQRTHVEVRPIDYYGIEVFSNRVCFIIDRSSSMRSKTTDPGTNKKIAKIELAKKKLIETLNKLRPGTMVNIISFDANYKAMAKKLTPLTRAGKMRAVKYVRNLQPGRGTNIYDTLSAALSDERVDTVFLLSDGQPTRGRYTDPETILRKIRTRNLVRNATINTIAVGKELELMKKLARENGGKYVFVD